MGILSAVEPDGDDYVALVPDTPRLRFCANAEPDACNWMIDTTQENPFCLACQHNLLALSAATRDVEFEDFLLLDCARTFALLALILVGVETASAVARTTRHRLLRYQARPYRP